MTIKLDVLLVQLIHIALLFWIFKKVIGDSLINALLERKTQIAKLEDADAEYKRILAEAQANADVSIKEGLQRKEEIITEATLVAKKKGEDIIVQAEKQAQRIQDDATQKAATLEKELKDGFVEGVRKTTKLVVDKLFKSDMQLQQQYVESLVQEFATKK